MKYQKELNLSVGLCRHSLATNVLALGAVADYGAQNCQYTTKVDAS
jgi:hypothetical protein